jgi:hypothetical protein
MDNIKIGAEVHGNMRQKRMLWKHRKYFALLKIAYDNWTPGEINSQYGVPMKNFERFRKDVAILTGHFELVIRVDGSSRPEAKSISFSKMDQIEFDKLYSKTIDLLVEKIYGKENMTAEKMNELVDQFIRF